MKHLLQGVARGSEFEVWSAGLLDDRAGENADPRMRRAVAARGIPMDTCAHQITYDDIERADLVLAMDRSNLRALERMTMGPEERGKLRLFGSYCRQHQVEEVPDPYTGTTRDFEYVLDLLQDGCAGLLEELLASER